MLGLLLFADPWLFHGRSFGAEGNQYTFHGVLAVGAGAREGYRVARASDPLPLALVVPLLLAVLGVAFMQHARHYGSDVLLQTFQHRIIGVMFLLGAFVKMAAPLRLGRTNLTSAGGLIVLLPIALQLIVYVEGGAVAHGAHHG